MIVDQNKGVLVENCLLSNHNQLGKILNDDKITEKILKL